MFRAVLLLCLFSVVWTERSFTIDLENDTFLKDGQPFRYVAGTMHYFKVPYDYWKDRMQRLKASGAQVLQTYIEWRSHEPEKGQYSWDRDSDFIKYIKMAQEEGLLVILRPGPFINAERDMGGLPYWLLRENPNMTLRSTDPTFLKEVDQWYSVLLPKIRPLLYSNGGPVIMVQVENEYGFQGCDKEYLRILTGYTKKYLVDQVVLYSTDNFGNKEWGICGHIAGEVYPTIDFGAGTDVDYAVKTFREYQPKGPLVNSEFYPGWLDHWTDKHSTVSVQSVVNTLDKMLSLNFSATIYPILGGTNFGFNAGANADDNGQNYKPCITSYDFDAPLTEYGDPTEKFIEVQKVIRKYFPKKKKYFVKPVEKKAYGKVSMKCFLGDIFDFIDEFSGVAVNTSMTQSFEALSQPNGFLVYSTKIEYHPSDPVLLKVPGLKDRGYVFVNHKFQGILSRQVGIFEVPIQAEKGDNIDILVENQGRMSFGHANEELKGINGQVMLGKKELKNWTHYKIPLHKESVIEKLVRKECRQHGMSVSHGFFRGSFDVSSNGVEDTFISLKGWKKGFVWINGFNLGRYWPETGPQVTLYVPKVYLFPSGKENQVLVFEQESSPCFHEKSDCSVEFVDKHILDSNVPDV